MSPVDRYYKDKRRERDMIRRAKKCKKMENKEGKKKYRKRKNDDEYW